MKKMKYFILAAAIIGTCLTDIAAQTQYKVITTIESIVPMGIGRSRIVEAKSPLDYNQFTTERISGKDSKQGKIKRKDAKIENLAETKLLNFYSGVGINFQNIASNDAMITSKLNELASEGWELFTVVSGVESDSGKPKGGQGQSDGKGIFITRYIFKK